MSAVPGPSRQRTAQLLRRLGAELLGTGLLVAIVIGSGIAAQRLSPHDIGLELLENSLATALGLPVLILMVGPVSGAHLNPVVSLADWIIGRPARAGLRGREVPLYVLAQVLGAVAGALLANAMFGLPPAVATTSRATPPHLLAEAVATAGLVLLVFALARSGRSAAAAPAVGAYIGAAYWFTSSTSFANPAVTVARMLSDTFAGIAPASVPPFLVAQLIGGGLGVLLVRLLYPDGAAAASTVVDGPSLRPAERDGTPAADRTARPGSRRADG
ncbi:aquaporin family protein [Amnibacterium sp. CER49]|uniref:aquaporin family protein n=1 Tax=Amnibacterium sp. CER49 TaxID=3039161 RepID=UPI0024486826|nr:aquaporin family protein [Amnibacterium sp. CER49]MDH2442839.1 aquaporin family protein [Amnibacterium sp. CER49]